MYMYKIEGETNDPRQAVRAGLALIGKTLRGWSDENGLCAETVRQAITGHNKSEAAQELRSRIFKAAGVKLAQ